ncbi:hypothetical protein, partial [Vibrio harveyi]|uniref:hypothetical protein n=1 Tax=Vibrio harveyi TaxID=669 RepID=UPI0018C24BB7
LSGGGNDLVGDQMRAFLKPYKTGAQAKDLIDQRAYDALLDKIEGLYVKLIKELRTVNSTIPILVHGYD